jgi:hypothetical protein
VRGGGRTGGALAVWGTWGVLVGWGVSGEGGVVCRERRPEREGLGRGLTGVESRYVLRGWMVSLSRKRMLAGQHTGLNHERFRIDFGTEPFLFSLM